VDPFLAFQAPSFIYVKIPARDGADGEDRSLDDSIDEALRQRGLGAVLGWGSSLGEAKADGSRPVAFHRIDIQVDDLESARSSLHEVLAAIGVPARTEIHCFVDSRHLLDVYGPTGWQLDQPLAGR
jgi:hypothetical protein